MGLNVTKLSSRSVFSVSGENLLLREMVVCCSSVLFCNNEKTGRLNVKVDGCDDFSVLVIFVVSEKMLRDGNIVFSVSGENLL